MATNSYGLDTDYLEKNLQLLIDRLSHYKPNEAARALLRLAIIADKQVINEPEFTGHLTAERDALQARLDGGIKMYVSETNRLGKPLHISYADGGVNPKKSCIVILDEQQ